MYLESHFRNDTDYSGYPYDPNAGPGTAGPDTLTGSEFADSFNGLSGDDTLFGLAGNDLLIGGADNDTLWGGAGADQFGFFRGFGHDTIMDYAVGDTIALYGFNVDDPARLAPFIDPTSETLRLVFTFGDLVEQIDVPTLARADVATATFATSGVAQMIGTEGADTLFAAEKRPEVSVEGLGGNDALVGTTGNERLDGGEGDDLLYEWDGTDTLIGGPGTDTVIYAGTRASYRVGIAGDTVLVQGATGTATLTGIEALRFADTGTILLADLPATPGTEELVTTLVDGTPTLGFSTYPVTLPLADRIAGTANNDVMLGTERNDFAILGGGDDAASMGAGDDILDGGTGSNFLTGGSGIDTYFTDGRGAAPTWTTITDWEVGEQLGLWGFIPGTSTLTSQDMAGALGYQGVTYHADLDGNGTIDTSITWAGRTSADIPAPQIFADQQLLWFVFP